MEWVEIIEPRTREHMYANLITGECLWEPPDGVPVKRTSDNQWWELLDQNTSRFYYYNAASQKTVWHKPTNCDIIPLAKLQTLKQNTEAEDEDGRSRRSDGSQTARNNSAQKSRSMATIQTQTSPSSSPRGRRHRHHHHRHHCGSEGGQPPPARSSRTKDASSRHSAVSDGAGSQTDCSQRSCRCRPAYATLESPTKPMPLPAGRSGGGERRSCRPAPAALTKQRSFECERPAHGTTGSAGSGSGSGMPLERARDTPLSRSYSFMQRRDRAVDDDAMHERFLLGGLRSVESTPQPRRRWEPPPPAGRDASAGVDSLCTPLMNRKPGGGRPRFQLDVLRSAGADSDSSGSPPSPQRPLFSPGRRAGRTSADSSPHSQFDSGVVSTSTTAGSQRSAGRDAARPAADEPKPVIVHGVTARPEEVAPRSGAADYFFDPATQANLIPLHQYILEQAKLSGYRFGDTLQDDRDSWRSEDSGPADDSDEFADDEGVSNADSSGLDDYLEEDDRYQNFILPPHLRNRQKLNGRSESDLVDGVVGGGGGGTLPRLPAASPGPPPYAPVSRHASLNRGGGGGGGGGRGSLPPPPLPLVTSLYSPIAERTGPAPPPPHLFGAEPPPPPATGMLSRLAQTSQSSLASSSASTLPDRCSLPGPGPAGDTSDIEKYAKDNLNLHKRGIFRKKNTVRDMLSWSKDPISQPMICTLDKALKKDACEVYKLIQIYMGDRKAKPGMTLNSVGAELAGLGWSKPGLRDEIYVQVCRQTTENPRRDSLRRGWELLAICLQFFPPSDKFASFLEGYIARHRDPAIEHPELAKWPVHSLIQVQISHYAKICCQRLERNLGKRNNRKPSLEEIDLARFQIFRCSMYGSTLQEVMGIQRDRFPHRRLPWIITTLTEEVLRLQGAQTEGIFRVPADAEEVLNMKLRTDQWEVPESSDCHVPASLLKQWYRELWEPLIPDRLYASCIDSCSEPRQLLELVQQLPDINRLVLTYLVRFLQLFSQPDVVQQTKMDASNLAMVFAPNVLRCRSLESHVVLENARKAMAVMKTLIQHMDTKCMEGVV
ncbi:rho GTPase-activating protein 39-like isoform X2 [Amphibalanus amphitrite]|nr:rho GTPase-activating protein 39-like isoform X2 [Amphibalanus amphitrite]